MDKYAGQRYVVRPGSVRGTRGEGTRWAAAAASSLLLASLLLALALPSALGHEVDPIAEFCGAMPNDGNPDQGRVGQGQLLKITTLGSGFFTAIVAAEYLIDPLMPVDKPQHHVGQGGNPMSPTDGAWGGTDEPAEAYNDTSFLPVGTYTIYLHVRGSNGQWSAFKTCSLEVLAASVDTSGPVGVYAGFLPDNTLGPGEILVTLNATFDDTGDPGNASVASAEYWYSGCGIGTPGAPANVVPPGGEIAEVRGANPIDTTGWADGTYVYYIAAVDSLGNQGGCYRADLFIIRNIPNEPQGPNCYGISANPSSVLSQPGQSTDLVATCDDLSTGSNGVFKAEFFVDPSPVDRSPNPGPYVNDTGSAMYVNTPPVGDDMEDWHHLIDDLSYSPPLAQWLPGGYTLRVHARDNLGTWGNFTDTAFTVLASGPSGLAIAIQGSDLRLDWTPAGMAGLDHYNVYRAVNDVKGFTFLPPGLPYDTVPAGATTWVDPGAGEALDANSYYYVVRGADVSDNEDANTAKVGKVPVDLVPGANELAIPFQLQDATTANVVAHLAGQYTSVGQFDPVSGWSFYDPGNPQALFTLDYRLGLRVHVSQPARFLAVGAVPGTTSVALLPGWNFVAYNALLQGSVPAILDGNGLSGSYDAAMAFVAADPYDQWQQYMPGDAAFRDLQDLTPGMSVWIRATAAASWNLLGEW